MYEFYRYDSLRAAFSNAEHIEVHAAIALLSTDQPDLSEQSRKGSHRLQPKINHLLVKRSLPNFPEMTRAEELCVTKRQILLKLPGVGNTTTSFEHTTPSKRIARAWCFYPMHAKAVLDAPN